MLQVRWSLQSNNPAKRKRMASAYKPEKGQKLGRPVEITGAHNNVMGPITPAPPPPPKAPEGPTAGLGAALFETLESAGVFKDGARALPPATPSTPANRANPRPAPTLPPSSAAGKGKGMAAPQPAPGARGLHQLPPPPAHGHAKQQPQLHQQLTQHEGKRRNVLPHPSTPPPLPPFVMKPSSPPEEHLSPTRRSEYAGLLAPSLAESGPSCSDGEDSHSDCQSDVPGSSSISPGSASPQVSSACAKSPLPGGPEACDTFDPLSLFDFAGESSDADVADFLAGCAPANESPPPMSAPGGGRFQPDLARTCSEATQVSHCDAPRTILPPPPPLSCASSSASSVPSAPESAAPKGHLDAVLDELRCLVGDDGDEGGAMALDLHGGQLSLTAHSPALPSATSTAAPPSARQPGSSSHGSPRASLRPDPLSPTGASRPFHFAPARVGAEEGDLFAGLETLCEEDLQGAGVTAAAGARRSLDEEADAPGLLDLWVAENDAGASDLFTIDELLDESIANGARPSPSDRRPTPHAPSDHPKPRTPPRSLLSDDAAHALTLPPRAPPLPPQSATTTSRG